MDFEDAMQEAIDAAPTPEVASELQGILNRHNAAADGTGSSGPGPK